MSDSEVTVSPSELLASGRRHLAVRDYNAAADVLTKACEGLAKEHGDMADQCAEAYLWYGKALLGLSREERGVFGNGMPAGNEAEGNKDEEADDDEDEGIDQEENGDEMENGKVENGKHEVTEKMNGDTEKTEAVLATNEEAGGSSSADADMPGPSSGDANEESTVDSENEDDVDNLQLAWEMLDLARNLLQKRVESAGGDSNRALLADVHLALGEVALESDTFDKAVTDMQSCLELQKELYGSDDRRIAETHYQIGLANSLASSFDDAITHFKNAANILETRIKTLENPAVATEDATVKKYTASDPHYSIEGEIKELKELLPEIREKIQDTMVHKAETIKKVRASLASSNGAGALGSAAGALGPAPSSDGASSSAAEPKPAATNISHLIKRKRKSSEGPEGSAPKKTST